MNTNHTKNFNKEKLESLQIARAISATMVVFHHIVRSYTVNAPDGWTAPSLFDYPAIYNKLAIGVDIFFVLSGFIMVYVCEPYVTKTKPVRDFITRRFIRIYPSYFIVTTAIVILMIIPRLLWQVYNPDLKIFRLIGSYTLFPTFNAEGNVAPILGAGWTLSYELYFYVLFAISVLLFRRYFLIGLALSMAAIGLAASALAPTSSIVAFLQNSIIIEFLMGCAIAWLFKRGATLKAPLTWIALSIFISSVAPNQELNSPFRFLYWGIPAALFISALVQLDRLEVIKWPKSILIIGDSSYAIYLIHIPLIYQFSWRVSGLSGISNSHGIIVSIAILLFSVTIIALGVAYFAFIERPMTRFLILKLLR